MWFGYKATPIWSYSYWDGERGGELHITFIFPLKTGISNVSNTRWEEPFNYKYSLIKGYSSKKWAISHQVEREFI